ncbi:MAG: glycosyltransferase [bacterium]|nr:glycosyltransferase [bacterium]
MRILFVTASLPYPPASGGLLRIYGLMHGLHQRGHQLTLISFDDGKVKAQDTHLATMCERVITVPPKTRTKLDRLRDLIFSSQPDIARRFYSDEFATRLTELLNSQRFDLVQFEGIEAVCYLPLVRQIQPTTKTCFDTFNAEYVLQRGIFEVDRQTVKRWPAAVYSLIQSWRIKRFEAEMCRTATCVIAVSPEDGELLAPFRPDRKVYTVPNGIFVDDYANSTRDVNLGANALVFTGKMDYRPNVDAALWFADHVLPLVQKQMPQVQFYIVGQQPHPRLDILRQRPGVHLTGWVDSTRPYLHSAAVYVAPLRMGSGTRLKLLEAMASGCVIVATSAASAGLHPEAKQGMIVMDDEGAMAQAIVGMLQNPQQLETLRHEAKRLVRQYYDWSVLIPRLLDAYKDAGIG